MIQKISGYRGMLRNRLPKVVDYALKWRKAKEQWVEHAYSKFVKIIGDEFDDKQLLRSSSENKKMAVRILLGIKKGKTSEFDFSKTIDWDNLTPEEEIYWNGIQSWVLWFSTKYAYIENAYNISKRCGKDEFDIKVEIVNSYLRTLLPKETDDENAKAAKYKYVDSLVNYLIKCFNDN